MKEGNWVPLDKRLVKFLPEDRPYSIPEAMLSLSCDYDNKKQASIAGYSKLWRWNRNKVRKFLNDVGAEIKREESTDKIQNQKGQIQGQIRDRSGTDNGQIRFIWDKDLQASKDRSGTDKGQIRDRSEDSTIYPIKPKPKTNNKYVEDCLEMKIAKYFYQVLLKSDPKTKTPNWQSWCDDIRKILTIDKRTKEEIRKVIDYAHDQNNATDKFSWIPNLRSPKKLRDHLPKILLSIETVQKQKQTGSSRARNLIEESKQYLG